MRIKHFSGYGCIEATKISGTINQLVVKVKGNHERGLDRSNYYSDVFNWLVKRFDKEHDDYEDISDIEFSYGPYEKDKYGDSVETAIYTIYFY